MTTYDDITNAQIDINSPLTTGLFTQLRDNPLAIQEGDPTAPKINVNAIANYIVGSIVEVYSNTTRSTVSLTYVKLKEIVVGRDGIATWSFNLARGSTPGISVYARIYKNGSPFGTERIIDGSSTYTEDLSFSKGDKIQLYARTANATRSSNVSNFQMLVGNPLMTHVSID